VMPAMFQPTRAMLADGPAFVIGSPQRFPMRVDRAPEGAASQVQPVIIHATLSNTDGRVLEAEALPGPDPALAQEALDLIEKTNFPANGMQQEVFVNVRYHLPQ
jgi:hypothetical protein